MGVSYLMRPDENMSFADAFSSMFLAGVLTLIIIYVVLFIVFSVVPFVVETLIPWGLELISSVYSFFATFIGIILKVIKSPIRLYSIATKSYKSQEVFSEEDLDYIFHNSINREMYVGDLLERLAFMKKKKEPLRKIRREMLKQIFIIKINSIKMKIENIFSNKKMKIDD